MRSAILGRATAPLCAVAAAIFAFGVGLSVAQAEDAKPADTKPADTKPATTTPAKPADAKPATTTTPATPKTTDTCAFTVQGSRRDGLQGQQRVHLVQGSEAERWQDAQGALPEEADTSKEEEDVNGLRRQP